MTEFQWQSEGFLSPFREVHILPLSHQADFLAINDTDLTDLAAVLKRTMARLEAVIGGAQYNYFLHSVPHDEHTGEHAASYHWHLEIMPKLTQVAGFEVGSGFYINSTPPEMAAELLRKA